MPQQERIQETRKLSEETIRIIQQADAKSPEQLIEVIEERLRHLKRTKRISENKESHHGYESTFLIPPSFV